MNIRLPVAVIASGLFFASCSAARPAKLEQARENLQRAQQDTRVAANAELPLYEANRSYRRAEQAWKDGADDAEVDHLAYVVNQRIEIARQTAEQKLAEAQTQQLAAERERIILAARGREAEQARQLAEARGREAELARQQAKMSGREAELAREEALAKAREAEQAQKQAEVRARDLDALRLQSETRIRELEQTRLIAEQAAAQNKQLEQELTQLKARQTERGLELTLSNVLFDFDKAILQPGAERSLNVLVDFLKANPNRRVTIEGHTDSLGADAYNRQLSQQRAEVVRQWFAQKGVAADRITAQGMGENFPVASNDTAAGRQENRRVELIIANAPEQSPARATRLSPR